MRSGIKPDPFWKKPLPRVRTVATPEGETVVWLSDYCYVSISSRGIALADVYERAGTARTGLPPGRRRSILRRMNYQLSGLEPALFEKLFDLDDVALAERGMRRLRSDQPVGFPCRISLEDTPVGEEVILLPFTHQDSRSPYRASGPIFVRRGRPAAARIVNALPAYLTLRPLSVRAYDAADEMVDAEVVDGAEAEPLIERYLARGDVAYLHIHYARRGCYACRVDRA